MRQTAQLLSTWVFINMTLTIFDWVEFFGHLPLYSVMAVLLVWTPKEYQRLWVQGVLGTAEDASSRKARPPATLSNVTATEAPEGASLVTATAEAT